MKKQNMKRTELSRKEIERIENHIIWRVSNVSTPKGGRIMQEFETTIALIAARPDWRLGLRKMVVQSIETIDGAIYKSKEVEPRARLTAISIGIGRSIVNRELDISDETHLRIGDILVDALFATGNVDIIQPGLHYGNLTWFVQWTNAGIARKSATLLPTQYYLRDTNDLKPLPTTTMLRDYADRKSLVVKRARRTDEIDQEAAYVVALDKVQGQRWSVNNNVLGRVLAHSELFINSSDESIEASQMIAYNSITQKAKQAAKLEHFYQLHDIDYRGRFYAMEPFFSFQGQDIARGLFRFTEGKAMTEEGWGWLYIHTACAFNANYELNTNPSWMTKEMCDKYDAYLIDAQLDTISVDKMALDDRITWTEQNIDTILSAGRREEFWIDDTGGLAAEKPVVFLAACIEIAHLVDNPGSLSHLPVAVDGSNNGWQHLIAMARDGGSAHLVGMRNVEIPDDFYLETGKKLLELLSISDDPEDIALYTKVKEMPMKHIRKGISKRGSMTKAYSAGAIAIGENMWDDCHQAKFDQLYDITEKDCYLAAKHLVRAIKDVCPGPLKTMKFFIELAKYELGYYDWVDENGNQVNNHRARLKGRRKELIMTDVTEAKGGKERRLTPEEMEELNDISKEMTTITSELVKGNGQDKLEWETPSGFRVCSEHHTRYMVNVPGNIQDLRKDINGKSVNSVNHVIWKDTGTASMRDSVSAISPNLVHSYDSAHLSIVAANWPGAIGVIHDSYSTHAADIPELLRVIKDAFIWMYEDVDIFTYLQDQLLSDDTDFDKLPPNLGDLDFNEIAESDFFFA